MTLQWALWDFIPHRQKTLNSSSDYITLNTVANVMRNH